MCPSNSRHVWSITSDVLICLHNSYTADMNIPHDSERVVELWTTLIATRVLLDEMFAASFEHHALEPVNYEGGFRRCKLTRIEWTMNHPRKQIGSYLMRCSKHRLCTMPLNPSTNRGMHGPPSEYKTAPFKYSTRCGLALHVFAKESTLGLSSSEDIP